MRLRIALLASTVVAASLLFSSTCDARTADVSNESEACIECHKKETPSLVMQWKDSGHAAAGVGCYECHKAQKTDKDAMEHHGFTVSAIVSPKDCGQCHPKETKEFTNSYHAQGGKFVYSAKNVLGVLTTDATNAYLGCAGCHGSKVEIGKDGKPLATTWPNNGIGRFNPDGSIGSCTACHYDHTFSLEQAREPATCGRCHQGPDHPDIEIYSHSVHGVAWESHKDEMKEVLRRRHIVAGEDYYQAPACFTCHMGATVKGAKATHDVGMRNSWNIRGPISKRTENWREKRKEMEKVCTTCHSRQYVVNYFKVYDAYVEMYNNKFAIPAKEIMTFFYKNGLLDKTPFNEKLEWEYWHLWHHEGRRGRHGAAMMGSDFAHWQGIYLVAYDFYFKLIPEADKLIKDAFKKGKIDMKVVNEWEAMKKEILGRPEHKWISTDKAKLKEMIQKGIEELKKKLNK